MFRRWWVPLILVVAILCATFGLTRLRFDTDLLSMLPPDLPEVIGLKAFHDAFSRDDELILLIQGGAADGGNMAAAAESLATQLKAAGIVREARWKPRWNDEPEGIAELLAYLWLNGPQATAAAQAARLTRENSQQSLQASLDAISTAMEGPEMVLQAHDPFGFLRHPAVATVMAGGQGREAFESADGRSHLLFLEAPNALGSYRGADAWLKKIRSAIKLWQAGDGENINVWLTGEPAFSSEIGVAMESDLSGSISITLGLIGLLFWWMQRRFSLLVGLVGVMIIVMAVALGIAGWLYGELSIIALSSIEILIGLAVDYGLVICQEAKLTNHAKQELRKSAGPPVMCGALTTTMVFLALNLGGLPGMAQMGTIVAIGLSVAAILMLILYLPFVVKFGVNRAPATGTGNFLPRQRAAWLITAAASLAAVVVLFSKGMPAVAFDSKIMRPRGSTAMDGFERVQSAFPTGGEKALGIVIEADTDAEMKRLLGVAHQRLQGATQAGLLESAKLPSLWWPDKEQQSMNRPILAGLASERARLLAEADAAGFTQEGLALGQAVMRALERQTAQTEMVFPSSPSAREILRLFVSRDGQGGGTVLGTIQPAAGKEPAGNDYEAFRTLAGGGIWLSGWELFRPAISRVLKGDLLQMLIPMAGFLMAMMWLIFRSLGDVLRALFAMAICSLWLLAIMSLTDLKWNFVNLMATPLLIGTGIDYAIHVTLSLRRTGGNFQDLWQGTGKALLFCGASNVIGFGSLIFSSSEALVSLGVIAVIGIVLSMGVSIFLLPGWHQSSPLTRPEMG